MATPTALPVRETSLTEALKKALRVVRPSDSKPATPAKASPTPDMSLLDVGSLTDEGEIERIANEAAQRREFSQSAVSALEKLQMSRRKLISQDGWEHDETIAPLVANIDKQIAGIHAAGGGHLQFAELVERIRSAKTEEQISAVLAEVCAAVASDVTGETRYRLCSESEAKALKGVKLPIGGFFWKGKLYLPFEPTGDGEEKSGAQKCIESVVTKMVRDFQRTKAQERRHKMLDLKSSADYRDDFHLIPKSPTPEAGLYRLHFPAEMRDERKFEEGVLIVKVSLHQGKDRMQVRLSPHDGAGQGNCHRLSLEEGKWYLTLGCVLGGVIPEQFRGDRHEAEVFIRLVKAYLRKKGA